MKKQLKTSLVVQYDNIKDEKRAELTAVLLDYYFSSRDGHKQLVDFLSKVADELLEKGYTISEGTC